MALTNLRPRASLVLQGAATHVHYAGHAFAPGTRQLGGSGLPSPRLLRGGRARRKETRPPGRPAPALTLTLVDGLESASEVTILPITVHFTPERRHRNPPTAATRHLGGNSGGAGRLLPRKRISEVAEGGGNQRLLSVLSWEPSYPGVSVVDCILNCRC